MPDVFTADPTLTALSLLFTALGLSSASGLRAYLPLLAVALGSDVSTGNGGHLVQLSPAFHQLGTPWLIGLLAILALAEFGADKVPLLDHASDALHTIIRPVAGAIVMAGTANPISTTNVWLAALIGAVLALMVHGAKAATRPVVTAATVGTGNPVVSLVEDGISLLLVILSVLAPILAIIFFVLLIVLLARPVSRGLGRLFGGRRATPGWTTGRTARSRF